MKFSDYKGNILIENALQIIHIFSVLLGEWQRKIILMKFIMILLLSSCYG